MSGHLADYFFNVYTDQKFGDYLAGLLLGTPAPSVAVDRAAYLKKKLSLALVAEGHRAGPKMNTCRPLCELFGAQAVAHAALAHDWRLIAEQLFGVPLALRGEPKRARRWREPPLEVFEMAIIDVSPCAHFIVAPFDGEDGGYTTWFLYERTMLAGGVSRDGAKAALREFSHHAKTFRVLLDGRVQRVRCLPPLVLFASLLLFGEHVESAHPDWVRRDRRPAFTRASKSLGNMIRGRVFSARGPVPQGSR